MLGRQIAIGFAIALILPMLIFYGVATFSPAPRPQNFVATPLAPNATPEDRQAFRDQQQAQQKAFKDAQQAFAKVLFFVAVPLGYAAILAGGFLPVSAVATGLIFGGIFTVINGHWGYWSFIADWQRFVSLLIAAGIVAAIAYRKMPRPTQAASAGISPPKSADRARRRPAGTFLRRHHQVHLRTAQHRAAADPHRGDAVGGV